MPPPCTRVARSPPLFSITKTAGAFRDFSPALVLSLLDPKLTWSEAESAQAVASGVVVTKPGGAPLSPYDLKRLQVRRRGARRAWVWGKEWL